MSYVDLHLHLLPGVDDGARDERESLDHAARMVKAGVREALVTPHVGHPSFPLDVATIPAHTAALQAALDREGIALRLHAGGEIHPDVAASLGADDLRVLAQGPPGARWVLVEVPFAGVDEGFLRLPGHPPPRRRAGDRPPGARRRAARRRSARAAHRAARRRRPPGQ